MLQRSIVRFWIVACPLLYYWHLSWDSLLEPLVSAHPGETQQAPEIFPNIWYLLTIVDPLENSPTPEMFQVTHTVINREHKQLKFLIWICLLNLKGFRSNPGWWTILKCTNKGCHHESLLSASYSQEKDIMMNKKFLVSISNMFQAYKLIT